jgi:hypothetical protein
MSSIAKKFHTYPTTIKRILERHNIELRHDIKRPGTLYVQNGEELIEWAKAQGRLVTKKELAHVIGKKKLSPSYFKKYPELGQYVVTHEQNELQAYSNQLYKWLQKNNISYKPNDRRRLGVKVTALLLGDYSNTVLQIAIKPKCVSNKIYSETMIEKKNRAHEQDTTIIFLYEDDFENLDILKERL